MLRNDLELRVSAISNLTKTLLESMGLSAANIHTISREVVYDQVAQLVMGHDPKLALTHLAAALERLAADPALRVRLANGAPTADRKSVV